MKKGRDFAPRRPRLPARPQPPKAEDPEVVRAKVLGFNVGKWREKPNYGCPVRDCPFASLSLNDAIKHKMSHDPPPKKKQQGTVVLTDRFGNPVE